MDRISRIYIAALTGAGYGMGWYKFVIYFQKRSNMSVN